MLDSCTSSCATRSINARRFLSRIRAESLVLGPPQHHDTPCSSPGGRSAANYLEKPQHHPPTHSQTAPNSRGGAICRTSHPSHLIPSHPSTCWRLTQDLTTRLLPSTGSSTPLRWGCQGGKQVRPFSNISCIPAVELSPMLPISLSHFSSAHSGHKGPDPPFQCWDFLAHY